MVNNVETAGKSVYQWARHSLYVRNKPNCLTTLGAVADLFPGFKSSEWAILAKIETKTTPLSSLGLVVRIAYFSCSSGISGDMTLGALLDGGASVEALRDGVRSLGLGDLQVHVEEVQKCGFRASQVIIEHPPEHAHRHLHQIQEMIDQADSINERAKNRAKQIFATLGQAEAKVHGTTIQKVHFHEVGAVDSIADIVGTAIALEDLGIEAIESSPVPTGTGEITIAHGRVAIPAPATAELLLGIPTLASDVPFELTTPTGAAILKTLARRFGSPPAMTSTQIGWGAGQRDIDGQANVLRVTVGTVQGQPQDFTVDHDQVVILETNLDNTPAEALAYCVERLWKHGALDVYQTPCLMKKGRAGVQVTVLSNPNDAVIFERILFEQTHTIGVRRYTADRHKLKRRQATVETQWGSVVGKEALLPDGTWRFRAEHNSVAAIAEQQNRSVSDVHRAVAEANANSKNGASSPSHR